MDQLSLTNVCRGAVEEVFQRELKALLKNMADPNTPAEALRKITINLSFKPSSDRAVAEVTFASKSTLAQVEPVKGTIFVSRAEGEAKAYPRDPRQDQLFAEGAGTSTPKV